MDSVTLLQVSQSVMEKSAEMLEKDPHGVIITLVSVSVVFIALVLLYYAYALVGRIVNGELRHERKKSKSPAGKSGVPTDEEAAAIGLALSRYLNDTVHDMESYIITIKRT